MRLEIRECDSGWRDELEVETRAAIEDAIESEYPRTDPEYPEGYTVDVAWWLYEDDEDEEIATGKHTVIVGPDHESLIHKVMGDAGCGDDPDDHLWTTEDEGGCTENPGVWSLGGTTMQFASHCERCGLRRTEITLGSQRNPGETDSVEYSAAEDRNKGTK